MKDQNTTPIGTLLMQLDEQRPLWMSDNVAREARAAYFNELRSKLGTHATARSAAEDTLSCHVWLTCKTTSEIHEHLDLLDRYARAIVAMTEDLV